MKSSPKTKVCTKCGIKKKLGEFYFNPSRQNYSSLCKLCDGIKAREYRKLNKVKIAAHNKAYAQKNKEKINAYHRKYHHKNKVKLNARQRVCVERNKERYHIIAKKYRKTHKEQHRLRNQKYRHENKAKISLRHKLRMETDINFKIATSLRTRMYHAIKSNAKAGSAVKDLGCSIEEFKHYIATKFKPGMTWKNWGLYTWHLDHIKPLAYFNLGNREEFVVVAHYTNYQPLWATTAIAREHGDFESIGNSEKGDKILNS